MNPVIRAASPRDVTLLADLMEQAHAEAGFRLDRALATAAFELLLQSHDRRDGAAWIAEDATGAAGYLVLTCKLSMESGGRDAFIDDVFVAARVRRRGIGTALLHAALRECRRLGIAAVHVEAGADDAAAIAFYASLELRNRGRTILTATLRDNALAHAADGSA